MSEIPPAPRGSAEPPAPAPHGGPGPSFWPALLAVGVAMALVGVITRAVVVIIGLVIVIVSLVGWVRDARHDYRELP
ncbi:MAG: aa3-type cytochrome oxidase subunit IV [Candidatus Dormibacteria bacterium]